MRKQKNPYPGVTRIVDRHGKVRWRFRGKGGAGSTYLPGPYGGPEFRHAYEEAVAGVASSAKVNHAVHGSLGWAVTNYLASSRYRGLSDSRKRSLRGELDWLRTQAGDLPLSRFGVVHVEALMDMKDGRPAAANTVRKNMSMLFRFAATPVKLGGLGLKVDNMAAFAKKREERADGYHTWTDAEMAQFLAHHGPGSKARLVFLLAQNMGVARADLVRLTRGNVSGSVIRYSRQKTRVPGEYPISNDLRTELDRLPSDQFLLVSHSGGLPYKPETLGNWFKDQATAAGLPHCTIHGIRKGQATAIAERGGTENELMAFLAHATTEEAKTYVKKASRTRLAKAALARLEGTNPEQLMSNLITRLDTIAKDVSDMKGKK